jgi:hypothetical protein
MHSLRCIHCGRQETNHLQGTLGDFDSLEILPGFSYSLDNCPVFELSSEERLLNARLGPVDPHCDPSTASSGD